MKRLDLAVLAMSVMLALASGVEARGMGGMGGAGMGGMGGMGGFHGGGVHGGAWHGGTWHGGGWHGGGWQGGGWHGGGWHGGHFDPRFGGGGLFGIFSLPPPPSEPHPHTP